MKPKHTEHIILAALCSVLSLSISGQEKLDFDQALSMALQNNHDIQVARLDVEVAENNASPANNRYLPTVNGSGAYTWTYNEGNFDLRSGDEQSFAPNAAYNYNASASLNYTLFDGRMRRFEYLQAKADLGLTEAQVSQRIEQTIIDLSETYHRASIAIQQLDILQETITISQTRLERAQGAKEYGQSTELDILNAEVDLATDSVDLLNAQVQAQEAMRALNRLMGSPIDSQWELARGTDIRPDIMMEEALEKAKYRNSRIIAAKSGMRVSEALMGASKGSWWPRLDANFTYNYRGSDDPNGAFVIGQSIFGPSAGVNMSWSLFDARNHVRVQNAKVAYEQQSITQQSTEQQVEVETMNAHGRYRTALFILGTQTRNVTTAQRNFERTEQAFKDGQVTSIEFRQAQLNLMNAQLLEKQATFDAKNAEMLLLSLMGDLVK